MILSEEEEDLVMGRRKYGFIKNKKVGLKGEWERSILKPNHQMKEASIWRRILSWCIVVRFSLRRQASGVQWRDAGLDGRD